MEFPLETGSTPELITEKAIYRLLASCKTLEDFKAAIASLEHNGVDIYTKGGAQILPNNIEGRVSEIGDIISNPVTVDGYKFYVSILLASKTDLGSGDSRQYRRLFFHCHQPELTPSLNPYLPKLTDIPNQDLLWNQTLDTILARIESHASLSKNHPVLKSLIGYFQRKFEKNISK